MLTGCVAKGQPGQMSVSWGLNLHPAVLVDRTPQIGYNICMTKPVKLVPIGNSTGIVLPKDILSRLKVDRGDQLYLSEAPDGSYRITPYDPEFARMMALGEEIMREDRDILHVLAQ
jgi:putative addiction module antidote